MSADFTILYEFPDPVIEDAWRRCLDVADMPTHFASPEYFREPAKAGEKRFALLALDPGSKSPRVIAALTGVLAGKTLRSGQLATPQICSDKEADPELVGTALAAGIRSLANGAGLITIFTWTPVKALADEGLSETKKIGTAALDLSAGPEKTFSRLKGRSQIRHAISAGVEVRQATESDIVEYYAILKEWSTRKKIPCPTLSWLQESLRLTGNRRLFVAIHEGTLIAGTPVRFYPKATAEYAWNVSRPESQHLRPNDLLHWRIIEWACREGIHTYLLGASHTFLLKYSDRMIPTYNYWADRTLLRRHLLKEQITAAAINTWQALPPDIKGKIKKLRG